MAVFHRKIGRQVQLENNGKIAYRLNPEQEFNNGVVFSEVPLPSNRLFEVVVRKKISSWSGSIEVGVSTCNPSNLAEVPISATAFREGTWVLSGTNVVKDGHTLIENYGSDLDQLNEGDRVGILRTSEGKLHFFINGTDQGVAVENVPEEVYVLVDMYGKCCAVSIVEDHRDVLPVELVLIVPLQFHERTGSLIDLSGGGRTAERRRPMDEFNNGVVLTNRPLRDDEKFEIRIERLLEKWSGSIEIGVTVHNPSTLEFPPTMTNIKTGTFMMSGRGILTNGRSSRSEYGFQNLDELKVGDRVAVVRRSDGNLHFYINGVDQGPAARCPAGVFGVVDLYGMATKVSILSAEEGESEESDVEAPPIAIHRPKQNSIPLLFHPLCGDHAAVINQGRTALRPRAEQDFNQALVFSSRPLEDDEVFEIQLDALCSKWAGSLELGLTSHDPGLLEGAVTSLTSCWVLNSNGIMRDGRLLRADYFPYFEQIGVGDRLGVMRTMAGELVFLYNGQNLGVAAPGVSAGLFAVVDLYGKAAQVSIVNTALILEEDEPDQASSEPDLSLRETHRFDTRSTGRNVAFKNDAQTACRVAGINPEFVFVADPLICDAPIELTVDACDARMRGSPSFGVTRVCPSEALRALQRGAGFAGLWLQRAGYLSAEGQKRPHRAPQLRFLQPADCLTWQRRLDGTVQVRLNGVVIATFPTGCTRSEPLWAFLELRGAVQSLSLISLTTSSLLSRRLADKAETPEDGFRWHTLHGANVREDEAVVVRTRSFNHALLFADRPLVADGAEFLLQLDELLPQWSGSMALGILACPPGVAHAQSPHAFSMPDVAAMVHQNVIFSRGCRSDLDLNLDSLPVQTILGLRLDGGGRLLLSVDGQQHAVVLEQAPEHAHVFVDLYGRCCKVSLVNDKHEKRESPFESALEAHKWMKDRKNDETVHKERLLKVTPPKNPLECSYFRTCSKLITTFALPRAFFLPEQNQCLCASCHRTEPLKESKLVGWTRFTLRRTLPASVLNKWIVAFCACSPRALRKSLDLRQVLREEELGIGADKTAQRLSRKDKEAEGHRLHFSPTISVATAGDPYELALDGKTIKFRVALQLLAKPGSYKQSPGMEPPDWCTKELGAVVLSAVLLRVEENGSE